MIDFLNEIPAHFHKYIVIHSHHALALKFDLKGIHLTSTHLSKKWKYFFVRQRLKLKFSKISKSRSYSRLQQVYKNEDYTFDYILIGTMFNSITGEFYSGFYEAGVKAAVKNAGKRFVARGVLHQKQLLKLLVWVFTVSHLIPISGITHRLTKIF